MRTITPMGNQDLELLRGAWEAFAAGDLEAATAALDPQVRWYAADEPDADGTCHNRGQALAFIRRARDEGVSAERAPRGRRPHRVDHPDPRTVRLG
jgi:hypothetical protein